MSDWVHCNTCYKQPGNEKKFHLTNCGHIYCDDCVNIEKETKCHICGSRCTTVLLAAKMRPDVEIFFIDPVELWKKQFRQMQKITQVMEFQKNHRSRLAAYNREMFGKQGSVMNKAQKAIDQLRDMDREVSVLKEENSYLKKLISGKGSQQRSSPAMARAGVGTGSSQVSPQHQMQAKMSLSQGHAPHHMMGIQGKTQSRMMAKTPPGRFGLPQSPSPTRSGCTPSMEANLPNMYESRKSRSGGHSPMNTSPAYLSQSHRYGPPLPPTCMPITPNRPVTPCYVSSSPGTSLISSHHMAIMHPRTIEGSRRPIQVNYPRPAFRNS